MHFRSVSYLSALTLDTLEDLIEQKNRTAVSVVLIRVKEHRGLVLMTINPPKIHRPWLPNQPTIKLKTRCYFKTTLELALDDIRDSDPYSFRIDRILRDSVMDVSTQRCRETFASSLRDFVRVMQMESLTDQDVYSTEEATVAPYKYQLYPLSRSHPLVRMHLSDLLTHGATLSTLVDGTVGMMPDDLYTDFELEPPHWQHYSYKEGQVQLVGEEMSIEFSLLKDVYAYALMIHRRWVELYASRHS